MMSNILEIRGLCVDYKTRGGSVRAVRSIDLDVPQGGTVGLVGESGSGKSTVARAVAGILPVSDGSLNFNDELLEGNGASHVQMIFQNPYASLNPRMTVGESIAEGVRCGTQQRVSGRATSAAVKENLDLVSLDALTARKLPTELSGGQRQRVAIARAIAAKPMIVLADEITSALDVSVQGSVLNLLKTLQDELKLSVLFISHDLAVVRYVSDSVAVMLSGEIVEFGAADEITRQPKHEYTRNLIASIPRGLPHSANRPQVPAERI